MKTRRTIRQEEFERLSKLMADKGVVQEAFELLADLRHNEIDNFEEFDVLRYTIVETLRDGGCLDFEGLDASEENWLQCLRKLIYESTMKYVKNSNSLESEEG